MGKSLCVAGWVKTGRQQGSGAYEPWAFLELNDGSTLSNLQASSRSKPVHPLNCTALHCMHAEASCMTPCAV